MGGADDSYPSSFSGVAKDRDTVGPNKGEMLTEVQLAAIQAAVQEAHESSKSSDTSSGNKNSGT